MRKLPRVASMAALLAAVGWCSIPAKGQGKPPTIKEIMKKAHQGANSPLLKLDTALKSDTPDWAAVQSWSHELVGLGISLGQNNPSKGDKASWDRLTGAYLANARVIEASTLKKDARSALAAHGQMTRMCAACHKAHK